MKLPLESTITSGIQDISALLPLLGTEQCEDHVSSSLVGGFLYAAATPLSIFGSLGLVSAGLKAVAASVVLRFHTKIVLGAKKLADIGLEPTGKVLCQIMWRDECHVAETQLDETLKKMHIADLRTLTVEATTRIWNWRMVITSLIALILSITPYIFLIENNIDDKLFLRWFLPLSRSIGSLIISNMVQILIQTRLMEIIQCRIIFLALNDFMRGRDIKLPSEWWDARFSSEAALHHLEIYLKPAKEDDNSVIPSRPDDEENIKLPPRLRTKAADDAHRDLLYPEFKDLKDKHLFATTHFSRLKLAAQILITCGIVLTVVGYIGCFSLVQSSSSTSLAPLIWLLAEIALSLVRMGLWAWNPEWDEKQTYLTFTLDLARHSPLSTCSTFYEDLEAQKDIPLTPSNDFLGEITSFVGSLETLEIGEGIAVYYTMTRRRSDGQRVLYATMIDYKTNIAWTLVDPSRSGSESQIDCRAATMHLKHGSISTIWANISEELSTDVNHTAVDRTFVAELKAHCDSILQKLRAHTFLEALLQAPVEVLDKEVWNQLKTALTNGYTEGLEQAAEEGVLPSTLGSKLVTTMVEVGRTSDAEVPVDLHAQAMKLRHVLRQIQNQVQKPELTTALEEAVKLRDMLRRVLALEPDVPEMNAPEAALAEVIMFGLVLAQRRKKNRLGQDLSTVVADVAAEVMALGELVKQSHRTLDCALWLALVLKQAMSDDRVLEEVRTEVRTEVRMRGLVRRLLLEERVHGSQQMWELAQERWGEEVAQPLKRVLDQTHLQRERNLAQALAHARTQVREALNLADAPQAALVRTLSRARARERGLTQLEQGANQDRTPTQTPTQMVTAQRPPLKMKLTWALKSMEEGAQMDWTKDQYHRRPWTDDDQDDMTYLRLGELESHKQQICARRYEWSKDMYSIARESLTEVAQSAGAHIEQTNYTMSGAAILEIFISEGVQDMERMLIEESSELEHILLHRVKATVAALQQRRAKDGDRASLEKKIVGEQKVHAMRRVTREGARVQERLERLRQEAHTRIREANHSARTTTLLDSQWKYLQSSIVDAWEQLAKTAGQDTEAPSSTFRKPIDLLQPQLKTWLEDKRETMKARLRRASNFGYVGLLNEYQNSRTSTFLVHRLLSKNSKFIRIFSDKDNGLTVNSTTQRCVSWVDCTTGNPDGSDVFKIIHSSWKERGVILILPKDMLKISDLKAALGPSQNDHVLFLDFPDAPGASDQVDEDLSTANKDVLVPIHHDGTFAYYQCVDLDDDSSYLVFQQPGESRCTVSFSVSAKEIAPESMAGQITIRLVHCRTSTDGEIDIHINRTYQVPWDEDSCPQNEFSQQDIALPSGSLHAGINTVTITLRSKGESASSGVYRMRDVQMLWPGGRKDPGEENVLDREDELEGWLWDEVRSLQPRV